MATEKRLIDANRIVEVAEKAYYAWNLANATADGARKINRVYKMMELCRAVKAVADDCPTVDAVEVVHGKWEPIQNAYGELEGWIHRNCGREVKAKDNYCPHCGAKMDLEVN